MRLMQVKVAVVGVTLLALASCGGSASVSGSAAPGTAGAPASGGGAASAAVSSPASAAASQKPAGGSVPVRLASSQNVTGNAPVWLTSQAGLFEKNAVNVKLESVSATAAIKQLVAGQIDGLVAGAPESISARAEGGAIQIVSVFQQACDMQMMAPKDVTALDQLKGKTVAVITKASVNGVCTVADLRHHGMQPDKDYQLIETGSNGTYAAMVAAIDAHHADAGAMQPSFARKLAAGGQFHILYDLVTEQGAPVEAASSLTFSASFIQAHPGEVQKTLDSLLQGEAYFKQHKDQAEGVLKSVFKITDQTQLDDTYKRLVQLLAKDITPRKELFPDLTQAIGQVQPKVKTMDLDALLAPSFAQNATQRGLTNF